MNLNDRAFEAIRSRTKRVEIRVTRDASKKDYSKIKAGDMILFTNSIGEQIQCEVECNNWYKTAEELLTLEGTRYTLSSTDDFSEGIKSINSFEGYPEGIKQNGIHAIHIKYMTDISCNYVDNKKIVNILYTNWKGKTSYRNIIPKTIEFKSTNWHKQDQWILTAFDVDKGENRGFAVKDIKEWR